MSRMGNMVIILIVLLNIGGVINIVFAVGKSEWLELFKTLVWVIGLNAVGFWLLRGLRDE